MYINTRLPARPKQILHYPNPPEARNLKKKAGSSPPEAQKLEARTSLLPMPGGETFVLNGRTAAEDIETFLLELKL